MAGSMVGRFLQARRDDRLAVLEGFHALKHALRFGAEVAVAATHDRARVRALAEQLAPELAGRMDTLLAEVTAAQFARLSPAPPREPVIALARRPTLDLQRLFVGGGAAPLVVLESPTHLPNVGAAVRVAAAASAAGLLVVGTLDPWHPTAIRSGAGLQFALPCGRIDTLPDTPCTIVAATPGGVPLREAVIPRDALLVFGSERRGLSPGMLSRAQQRVTIPMRDGVSSLSLATAVAVLLYTHRAHTGKGPATNHE